jgi:threonine dehydratase
VREIVHDRTFAGSDLSEVRVVCVVETTGRDHIAVLDQALADAGIRVIG